MRIYVVHSAIVRKWLCFDLILFLFYFTVGHNMEECIFYSQRGNHFSYVYFHIISSSVSVDDQNCYFSLCCTIN